MANGKRHRLTKRLLDNAPLPPKQKSYFLWDDDVRGFGVRIFASGQRVFYVDYRPRDGRERRRMPIGAYGPLTCEDARRLAKGHLGLVEWGKDPALERRTRRSSLTVSELCDQYLKAAENSLIRGKGGGAKKASTLYVDRGRITRHIKPLLGARLAIDLRTPDIVKFQRDVAVGKSASVSKTDKLRGKAVVTGGPGTAKRALGLLGGILSYAVEEGIIEHNPSRGVRRVADAVRSRRLNPDEYRELGRALDAAEAEGEAWQAIVGVKLLALTGARLGEIEGLEWSELDQASSCLRLNDSKEGRSTRPVGSAVFELVESIPRENEKYALAALVGDGRFKGLAKAVGRIVDRAGLRDVTAHTLRHSYASTAGDLGFSLPTIGALLGHAAGGVTSRYIHQLDVILVGAADKVAGEISHQMTGETGQVIQLLGRQAG